MKKLHIVNNVSDRLGVAVNILYNISGCACEELQAYIRAQIEIIKVAHAQKMPPGFSLSRKLYHAFGTDPTKYRPSSEALWRRVHKGLDFPVVNSFVDLINFLSLKYQVPYGLYDLDKIDGEEVVLDQGREGDQYTGIRKDIINLDRKILIRDNTGPFGNPSADSLRTSTGESSRNIMQVIFHHLEDGEREKIQVESLEIFKRFFVCEETFSQLL